MCVTVCVSVCGISNLNFPNFLLVFTMLKISDAQTEFLDIFNFMILSDL